MQYNTLSGFTSYVADEIICQAENIFCEIMLCLDVEISLLLIWFHFELTSFRQWTRERDLKPVSVKSSAKKT